MTSRFEELFSPDRLRQNWQSSLAPAVSAPPQNAANLSIHEQYLQLQRLVVEKFPDADKLSVIFQNLTTEIEATFGTDVTVPADDKQKQTIVRMLEELEELLSAMELPRWGSQ